MNAVNTLEALTCGQGMVAPTREKLSGSISGDVVMVCEVSLSTGVSQIRNAPPASEDADRAEQQATWQALKRILDENRLSDRKLFP